MVKAATGILYRSPFLHLSLPCGFSQSLDSVETTKRITPAVVLVRGTTDKGRVVGSGFIVSSDGKIATNLHVIEDFRSGGVRLSSGQEFNSFLVLAFDEQKDLAIIKVHGFDLPSVTLGNSDDIQVGEPMLIIGNPLGLQGSVTTGVISAIRDNPFGGGFRVLQTDAAVNPGNSGGPVVNRRQEVIGIVVFRLAGGENLNFALPVNYLRDLLTSPVSAMSLEEMRIKLGNRTDVVSPSKPLVPPLTQTPRIPNWWYTADPKKILADPLFPTLTINERAEILTQIDPKFAKMSSAKRHAYLWNAETDYLPSAEPPKEVFTWNTSNPDCSSEFVAFGAIKKIITANGVRIEATLKQVRFFKSHLKIVNSSANTVQIVPQSFVLKVVKPRQYTLFFEYPSRVFYEMLSIWADLMMRDQWSANIGIEQSRKIEPESMKAGPLFPGMAVEGDVSFESNWRARELVLRISIGDRAFDIPFTIRQ